MNKGIVTRQAFVRAVSQEQIENRQIEFVISTEAVDTYGTVFTLGGWRFERYNSNPVVVYAHNIYSPDPDVIIGTSVVRIEGNEVIGVVTFEPADINPLAEKVFRKVLAGTLRMASVGADVHEARWGVFEDGENPDVLYFTRQDLLEWSIVPVGSNPDALKRNTESLESIKSKYPKTEKREYPSLAVREAELMLNLKMQN